MQIPFGIIFAAAQLTTNTSSLPRSFRLATADEKKIAHKLESPSVPIIMNKLLWSDCRILIRYRISAIHKTSFIEAHMLLQRCAVGSLTANFVFIHWRIVSCPHQHPIELHYNSIRSIQFIHLNLLDFIACFVLMRSDCARAATFCSSLISRHMINDWIDRWAQQTEAHCTPCAFFHAMHVCLIAVSVFLSRSALFFFLCSHLNKPFLVVNEENCRLRCNGQI